MDLDCETACLKHCLRRFCHQPGLVVGCSASRAAFAFGLFGRGDPALLWFFRERARFWPGSRILFL